MKETNEPTVQVRRCSCGGQIRVKCKELRCYGDYSRWQLVVRCHKCDKRFASKSYLEYGCRDEREVFDRWNNDATGDKKDCLVYCLGTWCFADGSEILEDWRPFVARRELPLMMLQAVWKYEDDERVEMFITNYFIGRFPPEYNNVLIERFENECVEARKEMLKGRHLEYIDSVVALYRASEGERCVPEITDCVQAIVRDIEEQDKKKGD